MAVLRGCACGVVEVIPHAPSGARCLVREMARRTVADLVVRLRVCVGETVGVLVRRWVCAGDGVVCNGPVC